MRLASRIAIGCSALGLVPLAAAACSKATDIAIERQALGRWDCAPPADAEEAPPLTVEVSDGRFALAMDFAGQRVEQGGAWDVERGKLTILWDVSPTGAAGITVDGVSADATALDITGIGESFDGEVGRSRSLVQRTGDNEITIRDDSPDAVAYTCRRDG